MKPFYDNTADLATLLIVAVGFLIWISKLLLGRWKDRDIEGLRQEHALSRVYEQSHQSINQEMIRTALLTSSADYLAAANNRVASIKELWKTILRVRTDTSQALMPYAVLTSDERSHPRPFVDNFLVNVPVGFDAYAARLGSSPYDIEAERPFLGERLWLLFFIYRAVAIRMSMRVSVGLAEGSIPEWDQENGSDDGVIALLSSVISDEEISYLRGLTLMGPQSALNLLEHKMLVEMDARLRGRYAGESSFQEGKRLLDSYRQVSSNQSFGTA